MYRWHTYMYTHMLVDGCKTHDVVIIYMDSISFIEQLLRARNGDRHFTYIVLNLTITLQKLALLFLF